jgi:hypothetical protein
MPMMVMSQCFAATPSCHKLWRLWLYSLTLP